MLFKKIVQIFYNILKSSYKCIIIEKKRNEYIMKITVLDKKSFGNDLPLNSLASIGELTVYEATDDADIVRNIGNSEIIVLNKVKITKDVIDRCNNLKLICVFATGFDNIDINAAREKGIAVCNVPGYSTDSVALCTVATALSLVTNLRVYNNYVTSGAYTESGVPNRLEPVFHEISGMIWGIIGAGNIGKAVGKVAEAMGAKVIYNKRTPDPNLNCVDITTLAKESDIITVHCPLNDSSLNLINKELISMMKKNVIIVNEARGAVVNDNDIVEAVETNRIAAFGSDVYTKEPFDKNHPFNRIMHRDNVLLTPHFAWGSYESRLRCLEIVCRNIKAFLNNEKLNRID